MELKLWDKKDKAMAKKISSLIVQSVTAFKETLGGHVPDYFVEQHIHKLYASIESVTTTFQPYGHRFVMVEGQELLGTILVSREPDLAFIVDSKHINIIITPGMHVAPVGYHWIINYVVAPRLRKNGLARYILEEVLAQKHLWSGRGFGAKVEPPLHNVFERLGFRHLPEYDTFFEEGVSLPLGTDAPLEFNVRYQCRCEGLANLYKTRKIKDLFCILDFK